MTLRQLEVKKAAALIAAIYFGTAAEEETKVCKPEATVEMFEKAGLSKNAAIMKALLLALGTMYYYDYVLDNELQKEAK